MTRKSLALKILGVIAGVVFIGFGIDERRTITGVKSFGRTAIVEPIEGYSARKSKGMTTYTSEFTFKTDDGRVVTRKKSFPEELIKDFESRTPVKVYYDPRYPSEFVFEKENPSWLPIGMGVAFVIGALLFA
jgi:hypothetical protein